MGASRRTRRSTCQAQSGEDGEASSSDGSSDAFVALRTVIPMQNNLGQKKLASRNRGNAPIKQRVANEAEPTRECAKAGSHETATGKVKQEGNMSSNGSGMQWHTTFDIHGSEQNGNKATTTRNNTPSGGNRTIVHDVSPISSAPPLVHFVPESGQGQDGWLQEKKIDSGFA